MSILCEVNNYQRIDQLAKTILKKGKLKVIKLCIYVYMCYVLFASKFQLFYINRLKTKSRYFWSGSN